MKNTIRNTLLISAASAALMMGAGLATAQVTNDIREAPGPGAHDQKPTPAKTDQQPGGLPKKRGAPTTVQAPVQMKPAATAQAPIVSKPQTTGQGAPAQPSLTPTPQPSPRAVGTDTKSGMPAPLSTEQHAKFRETLRGEKTERLTDVHFSTTVGEVVPGTVHLYRLPVSIMEYAPQYSEYEYILVGNDILIVDPHTLRIVAVIAA